MDETRSSLVNRVTIWDPSLYETELMCICTKTRRTMFSRILSSIVLLCCSSHRPCNLESLYSGPHHDVAPISSREQAWSSIFSHYEQWSCTHASTQIVTKWALCLPRSLARTCGICTIEKPLVLFPAWPRFCLSCSLLSPQAGKPHGD